MQAVAHIDGRQRELLLFSHRQNGLQFDESVLQRVGILRIAKIGQPAARPNDSICSRAITRCTILIAQGKGRDARQRWQL